MKLAPILLAALASGCATQMVEKDANDSCAAKGKKAFIADTKQSGIPLLIESAHAEYFCVGPDDITHLPAPFGADVIWANDLNGVGIISVARGSVAEAAGLKPNDVLREFAGSPVARAGELQSAIEKMSPGEQATLKVRRKGQDTTLTARF